MVVVRREYLFSAPPYLFDVRLLSLSLSFDSSRSRRLTFYRRISFSLDRRRLQGRGGFGCLRFVSIRTSGEGARCCRRQGWFVFLVFIFVSFGRDVGGFRGVLMDAFQWLFDFHGSRTI